MSVTAGILRSIGRWSLSRLPTIPSPVRVFPPRFDWIEPSDCERDRGRNHDCGYFRERLLARLDSKRLQYPAADGSVALSGAESTCWDICWCALHFGKQFVLVQAVSPVSPLSPAILSVVWGRMLMADGWKMLLADAEHFLVRWSRITAAIGWTAFDLFGVHQTRPAVRFDVMGLLLLLQGGEVTTLRRAGSLTLTSRTILPVSSTMQMLVSLTDTSSPAAWPMLRFSFWMLDASIAIAQTPYSAYPNPPSRLERVAGATTDIQYLVHQGFTAYNATFWVGANAALRYSALNEIRAIMTERGHAMPVFIQDKTLIEDTGSTIDLVAKGWRLHNHPERLAYSATPPDFGALVIQRQRWANGGLIILPSLLALWRDRSSARAGELETFVRSHYLISPALANVSLLLLLVIPFGEGFSSIWFPIAAAPYYLLYGRDLIRCGYKWSDLLRVYALTLLLVPVNLAGVYQSLEQIVTGRKSAFDRTPKIDGRTAAPPSHLIFLAALLTASVVSAAANLWSGSLLFCGFSAVNVVFFVYGFWRLIGWRDAADDIRAGILSRRTLRDRRSDTTTLAEQPSL